MADLFADCRPLTPAQLNKAMSRRIYVRQVNSNTPVDERAAREAYYAANPPPAPTHERMSQGLLATLALNKHLAWPTIQAHIRANAESEAMEERFYIKRLQAVGVIRV